MTTTQISEVIQHVRCTLPNKWLDRTDEQLLEAFVSRRDSSALEVLVLRHSAMVWGVCLRVLHNHADAEDAFQATFLVLLRKSASIVPRALVGNWLYGVAYKTAVKLRAIRTKRYVREKQLLENEEPASLERDICTDLQSVLDRELSLLPEKYRAVLVLCELEGRTKKDVSRELGLPEGTVASRFARAKSILAKRLARHGLTSSGLLSAALLPEQIAMANVPSSLLSLTMKVLTSNPSGSTPLCTITNEVRGLTEGVLLAMSITKFKRFGVVASLMLVAVAATLAFAFNPPADTPDSDPKKGAEPVPKQVAALNPDPTVQELSEVLGVHWWKFDLTKDCRSIEFGFLEDGRLTNNQKYELKPGDVPGPLKVAFRHTGGQLGQYQMSFVSKTTISLLSMGNKFEPPNSKPWPGQVVSFHFPEKKGDYWELASIRKPGEEPGDKDQYKYSLVIKFIEKAD